MSDAHHIEPKADEAIIWRHSAGRAIPVKRMSEKQIKRWNWAFRILWILWLIYWFSRPSTWEQIFSRDGLTVLVLTLVVIFLGSKIIEFFGKKLTSAENYAPRVFPIWMSKSRLVFSAVENRIESDLNLRDIRTVTQDYDDGSPILILASSTATFKLITSELIPLQDKLFTLRPDLRDTA